VFETITLLIIKYAHIKP